MKKLVFALSVSLVTSLALQAQNKENEKGFIKKMCGCYEVDFEYAETFSESKDYKFHDRYSTGGLEWVFVDEESEDKLVLQHLLVINDSTIIKHWRQDWHYENEDILVYHRNLEWEKAKVPTEQLAGSWTQKVYQVDDSPRYDGYAHWVHMDGRTYWESEVFAPLPRRERTKRSDYNVMLRNNKHRITDYGHLHELDNAKVIRTAEKDSVLVLEKGHNTYTRVDDKRCQPAMNWWKGNRSYWVDVRTVWTEIIAENEFINLEIKIDDRRLWQVLFQLGDEYAGVDDYKSKKARKRIRKAIEPYLSDKPSPWETASATDSNAKY